MQWIDNSTTHAAWVQLWQVTVLVLLVAGVASLLARNRPHLAYVLWLVVLIKCVTPPLWSSPSGMFCWLQSPHADPGSRAEPLTRIASSTGIPLDIQRHAEVDATERRNNSAAIDSVGTADLPDILAGPAQNRQDPAGVTNWSNEAGDEVQRTHTFLPIRADSVIRVALLVWFIGVAVMLVIALLRGIACLRLARRHGCSADVALESTLEKLAVQLKLARRPRLCITRSHVGPAVVGLLRPIVLIPEILVRGRSPAELEPILAHELIHVRRGDLWIGLLQLLAQGLWWFHPLVWLANRCAAREAERCCDEEVIAELGCDPARYARSLVAVLELKHSLQPVPAFPGVRPVELTSKRLERIMNLGQGSLKRTPWWCWLVMLAAAVTTLPGAALVVTADDKSASEPRLSRVAPGRVASSTGKDNHQTVRVYPIATLLERIRAERDLDEVQAKDFLTLRLRQLVGGPWTKDDVSHIGVEHTADSPVQRNDQPHGLSTGKDTSSLAWFGRELVVRQSVQQHARIHRELEFMRDSGFDEILLTVRFANGPPDVIDKLSPHGLVVPPETTTDKHPWDSDTAPLDWALPGNETQPRSCLRMVVEKHRPVMFELIDEQRAAEVLKLLQGHTRVNLVQAPRIALLNGQSGTIVDGALQHFVISMKQGEPQWRVVREGLMMRLRPVLRENGNIWLDCEMLLADILDIKETTIVSPDDGQEITLQVPEVAKTQLDLSLELPPDKTLLVGGLNSRDGNGKLRPMLVMLRAAKKSPQVTGRSKATKRDRTLVGVGVNSEARLVGTLVVDGNGDLQGPDGDLTRREGSKHDPIPIFGPITTGGPDESFDPPGDEQILKVLQRLSKTQPKFALQGLTKEQRKNVRIVKEKIADYVDPPQMMPLIGQAQRLHTHYKCTIHINRTTDSSGPVAHQLADESAQVVVYVHHQHLRHVRNVEQVSHQGIAWKEHPVKLSDKQTRGRLFSEFKLHNKVRIDFQDIPLDEAVKRLAKRTGLNMHIFEPALAEEGVRPDTPVTLHLNAPIRVESALTLLLDPLHLVFVVKDEVIEITNKDRARGPIFTRVYAVADLVVPVATWIRIPEMSDTVEGRSAADFEPLIELITSTIEPNSWDHAGGPGSIRPFPTNLSLVISQNQAVHEEIADLLDQLRRLKDTQVALTVQTIHIQDDPLWQLLASEFDSDDDTSTLKHAVLSPRKTRLLQDIVGNTQRAMLQNGPKVTMLNGQSAEVPVTVDAVVECHLELTSVISPDRQSVRLTCRRVANDSSTLTKPSRTLDIPSGGAVLYDVSDGKTTGHMLVLIRPEIISR